MSRNRKYAKSSMQTPFLWMEPSRPQKTKVNGLWHTVQPVLTWPWQSTHFGPARENNQVDKRIVLLITLVSNEISVTQIPANRKHVKQSMETLSLWKGESQGGGEPFLKQWQYNLNQPAVHSPVQALTLYSLWNGTQQGTAVYSGSPAPVANQQFWDEADFRGKFKKKFFCQVKECEHTLFKDNLAASRRSGMRANLELKQDSVAV